MATTGVLLADQSVDAVQHEPSLTEAGRKAAPAEVDVEQAAPDEPDTPQQPSKPQHNPEIPPLIRFLRTFHWHISYNPLIYVPTPLIASLALLLPLILIAQKQAPDATKCAARTTECGFEGNEDAYGLGIRLGVYLQWLATFLIYVAVPSEERSSMAALAMFSFSLLLAVVVLTFETSQSCVFEIEIIVMLFIVFTTQLVLSVTHTGRDIYETNEKAQIEAMGEDMGRDNFGFFENAAEDGVKPLKRVGTFMSSLGSEQGRFGWTFATGVIDVYSVTYLTWFWIRRAMPRASSPFAPTPCGTSVFLIGRIRGESSIRATSAFLAASFATFFAFNFLNEMITRLLPKKQASQVRGIVALIFIAPLVALGGVTTYIYFQVYKLMGHKAWAEGLSKKERDKVFDDIFSGSSLITIVVISVIGTELSLVWNQVSGVYSISSTGQLIPFVIGLAGFLPICWKICRHKLYKYHQQGRERAATDQAGVGSNEVMEEEEEAIAVNAENAVDSVSSGKGVEGTDAEERPDQAEKSSS